MIDMHSKYNNMHTSGIFNTLICINNHVNSCINYMLSVVRYNTIHGFIWINLVNSFSEEYNDNIQLINVIM